MCSSAHILKFSLQSALFSLCMAMRILFSMFWFAIFIFRVLRCEAVIFDKYHSDCANSMSIQTPPTYKCPHGRPCYFLSTNWPTVIYGSKYFFPNIFIFLFFLYSSSSSMDASNARKASITSLNHRCSCGSSWNNV